MHIFDDISLFKDKMQLTPDLRLPQTLVSLSSLHFSAPAHYPGLKQRSPTACGNGSRLH